MWNGMLSPHLRKHSNVPGEHISNPTWEVTDVIDGFAQVRVFFNHVCHWPDGSVTYPDSNSTEYIYEYQVGPGIDEAEATDDIQSRLGDKYGAAELIDLLETS